MKKIVIRLLVCCSFLCCAPVKAMKEIEEEFLKNTGTSSHGTPNPLGLWKNKKEKYRFFASLRKADHERCADEHLSQNQTVKLEGESQSQVLKKIQNRKIRNRISAQRSRDRVKAEIKQLEQVAVANPKAYGQWLKNNHQMPTTPLVAQNQEPTSRKDILRTRNRISAQRSRDSQKEKLTKLRAFSDHLKSEWI